MSQNVWATIMPFAPVTLIFYWPKFFFFSGTATGEVKQLDMRIDCI